MSSSDIWTLIISFFLGIAASVIASIIIICSQKRNQLKRNLNNFKKLEGKYQHTDTHKNITPGNFSDITFEPPNKILIKTSSTRGHNWNAKIIMSEIATNYGEGYYEYEYPDQNYWGEISIQVSRNNKELLVSVIDKSQKEIKQHGYMMIKI